MGEVGQGDGVGVVVEVDGTGSPVGYSIEGKSIKIVYSYIGFFIFLDGSSVDDFNAFLKQIIMLFIACRH
jgi:hypothetical protein